MYKIAFCTLLLTISNALFAIEPITLQAIVEEKYKEEKGNKIVPLNDGEHYTASNDTMIIKYSYATGRAVDTLFNAKTAKDCTFKKFDGYSLSADEKRILLYTDKEMIYRNSFEANYYTCEIKRHRVYPLSNNGKQRAAIYSPNGRMVAFVRDNNIFIKKLDYNTESAVTTDGSKEKIINGVPDWVNEEEFITTSSIAWSPDNNYLCFVKYNETNVPAYSLQLFEGLCPSLTEYSKYPGISTCKYPVAGGENAKVSVHSFNVDSKKTITLTVPLDKDGYIPRILFTAQPMNLAVATLNRNQNQLRIYTTHIQSGVSKLLLQENSETWVDEDALNYLTFYPDFFIFSSQRSGYRHLYKFANSGTLTQTLTKGKWDVTAYLGYNASAKTFYFQSTQEGAINRTINAVNNKGEISKISEKIGTNTAQFNATGNYFINQYSNINTPLQIAVYNNKGKLLRTIEENKNLVTALTQITYGKKEFFTFTNNSGIELNGWLMKPLSFDANKQYPLVMVQYSGPGSQCVLNRWEMNWEQVLTTKGFVVACIDGRGTGGRGKEFEHCVYKSLGTKEVDDQAAGATFLSKKPFIDKKNIAIYGWSFGGFTSLLALTHPTEIFKTAVSVAPITDWRFYDTIFTERYMRTPKENKEGYDNTSPLLQAEKLKGNLLIMSGTADDNVHLQNTLQLSEALVQANIQFEMQLYTNRNHNIKGCNTRLHLYTRIINFLEKNIE